MLSLPNVKGLFRTVLGQKRQVSFHKGCLLIELREGAKEDEAFVTYLEGQLSLLEGITLARYMPEIDRLLVFCKDTDKELIQSLQETLVLAERKHNWHHALYSTRTRFPEEKTARYRALLEIGMDAISFGSGFVIGKVGQRTFNFFTDLGALGGLMEATPELRRPMENWLGPDNAELLLGAIGNVSDSFSQGWSGSLVDIVHRLHEWQSEQARENSWIVLRDTIVECIASTAATERPEVQRPVPIPDGPVEQYLQTAETLSLASFSAGMALTHSLNRSAAMLFASVPKPALRGRDAYCNELVQQLARQHILTLNEEALRRLDRVDRIVIDETLLTPAKQGITSVLRLDKSTLELAFLDELLEKKHVKRGRYRYSLSSIQSEKSMSAAVKKWWTQSGQPLSQVRLVKRDKKLLAAFIVQQITDQTIESVLMKIRSLGLKADVMNPDVLLKQDVAEHIAIKQRMGSTVLAFGRSGVLCGADIAVGFVGPDTEWPSGADLLVSDVLGALWTLLGAIECARKVSEQSVELAKIDAFSGLILSLDRVDPKTLGRIRLAANVATLAAMMNGYRNARGIEKLPLGLQFDVTPWHAMDIDTALERIDLKLKQTETREDVAEGDSHRDSSLMELWLEEMSSPLVPVLLTGAGLAAFTGALGDALLISSVVAANGLMGGIQRRNTERKLGEMGMTTERTYCVLREGDEHWVNGSALRPGDRIRLEAGDVVPADARIVQARALEMDESSLTGESLPVKKNAEPSYCLAIAERSSMLYEGTSVSQGIVAAIIVTDRLHSESRRSHAVQRPHFNGVESRLDHLTELTVPMAAFSGIAIMLAGLSRNRPVQEVIGAGVSLAVAAVPEGLPIMATMAQLSSAGRLSEMGAFARNPRAIEALGRMSVLCADKTGTLTEGRLALQLLAIDGEVYGLDECNENAQDMLLLSLLASPEGIGFNKTVHVTDEAVGKAAREFQPELFASVKDWKRIAELPFKSERGYHAGLYERDQQKRLCVKGAPDILLARCNRWMHPDGELEEMDAANRDRFTELSHALAARGYRVLAVAERPARSKTLNRDKVKNLIFRGFLAMSDPVRSSAKLSVQQLHEAGIDVKMITGDHPVTAQAIARELDINGHHKVMTGSDIDALSEMEFAARVQDAAVFARVTPAQKAKIVTALQARGEVVGMTGDGANDAAAIRLAEVGIALGEDSSFAAQKAADLFVVDGRIETIVAAVLEGRALWTAVRDAVSLLVGGNLGEIGFTLVAGLLDGKSPLNARQLLLVNLLTDTIPALAVAMRKPDRLKAVELLSEGPEASLGEALNREIQWRAGLTGGLTLGSWTFDRLLNGAQHASTVALLTLIGSQLMQTLFTGKGSKEVVISSASALAAMVAIVQTPGINAFFGCTRPGISGWANVCSSILVSVIGAELLPRLTEWSEPAKQALQEKLIDWLADDDVELEPEILESIRHSLAKTSE